MKRQGTVKCDPFIHKVLTCAKCDTMTRATKTKISDIPKNNTWVECVVTHLPVEIENIIYRPGEKYYFCPECYNNRHQETFGE
jgi:uncharacterized C2H2 Zn-finger protein